MPPLHARGEELTFDATPMIDVCVLLIVFFLLSLRVETVEERIEHELPHDPSPCWGPFAVEFPEMLTVRLNRELSAIFRPGPTEVRVGHDAVVSLPAVEGRARDDARLRILDVIADWRVRVGPTAMVVGEIKTRGPSGWRVPHGDVMTVLDAMITAGVADVRFEGAMPPIVAPGPGPVIDVE